MCGIFSFTTCCYLFKLFSFTVQRKQFLMRYILSLSLIFFYAFQSISQEKHFILIQSETRQLFNVTINGKVYSTNSSGYVIIPKLENGEYIMVLGFPENTFPDQAFKFVIDQKDVGFNLQNLGEKGWVLSNLQTQGSITAEKEVPQQTAVSKSKTNTGDEPITFNKVKDTVAVVKIIDKPAKEKEPEAKVNEVTPPAIDSSSITMSAIVSQKIETKDTAVVVKPVSVNAIANIETKDLAIVSQPVPDNIPSGIVAKDSAITNPTPIVIQPILSSEPVLPAIKEPEIKKLAENRNEEGLSMSFSDLNDKRADTVDVYIKSGTQPNVEVKDTVQKTATDSIVAAKIEQLNNRKDDVKFIEIDMDKKSKDSTGNVLVDASASVVKHDTRETDKLIESEPEKTILKDTAKASVEAAEAVTNNNPVGEKKSANLCKSVASELDYIKLRRKMALEDSDDRMIREARKAFKETCFTTNQMKGLSTLFLSDEGRYHFFSSAYSFVSDPEQYSTLQSEFIDPYFINRFKSIIHR